MALRRSWIPALAIVPCSALAMAACGGGQAPVAPAIVGDSRTAQCMRAANDLIARGREEALRVLGAIHTGDLSGRDAAWLESLDLGPGPQVAWFLTVCCVEPVDGWPAPPPPGGEDVWPREWRRLTPTLPLLFVGDLPLFVRPELMLSAAGPVRALPRPGGGSFVATPFAELEAWVREHARFRTRYLEVPADPVAAVRSGVDALALDPERAALLGPEGREWLCRDLEAQVAGLGGSGAGR